MLRAMLRSKIHRATVTQADLEYEGSLTLDEDLMDAAGLIPFEQVVMSNLNNGERFATYVIPGARKSGVVCLNGPTARKGAVGDRVIIFCYAHYSEEDLQNYRPVIVKVHPDNQIRSREYGF
ncbi:MAG: aspartate 1-decarboxylase [Leptospirillum sp.]